MYPPRTLVADPLSVLSPEDKGSDEPYSEIQHMNVIEDYAHLALDRKEKGADKLFLRGFSSLVPARAALLGARSAGVPVYVFLEAAPFLEPEDHPRALAALICLQSLGAAGFGFEFASASGPLVELYAHLAPYTFIPLAAWPDCPVGRHYITGLLQAGMDVLCSDKDNLDEASKALEGARTVQRPDRPEDSPLLLCDETGVYYLEEDFTMSQPIECSLDMSEAILEQEDEAVDALCFLIETMEDAMNLGHNAHMCRNAACLQGTEASAMEMALTLYPGRVLVDSRSELEENTLLALAKVYGAIVR